MSDQRLSDFTTYGNKLSFDELIANGVKKDIRAHIEYREGRKRQGREVMIVAARDNELVIHDSRTDKKLGSIVQRDHKFYFRAV